VCAAFGAVLFRAVLLGAMLFRAVLFRAVLLGAVLLGGALLAAPALAAQESDQPAPLDVVEVSGLLDPVVADFISKSIDRAEDDGAQALVIQFNSRKAVIDDDALANLADEIADAEVPVAIWVGPSGARAYEGSGQLVLVADVSGVSPGSRIGNFGDPIEASAITGEMKGTIEDFCCSSLGAAEAVAEGVVDLNAPVLGQFVVGLDGIEVDGVVLETARTVPSADGPRIEPNAQVRFFKLDLLPRLMHTVASPPVAYLLLTIGLVLLVFEFYVAGVGIAGGVGAMFLVLAAYGLAVLPTRPVGLALILLSMLAFAIDVQTGVPRVWTGIGTAAFTAGSLLLYDGLALSWITLLAGIAGVLLAMLAGMPTMIRTRFATPTIGREWMIGEMGEATADIDPDGVVRVRGALWRARTNRATPLRTGDSVRVVDIDGPVLEVEPEAGGARDYREQRRRTPDAPPPDAPENPSGLADGT
jgi:membrane-bound serine protease (ClpP class)